MGHTSININYNIDNLCEEISFSTPGIQSYTLGSLIVLSDERLSRPRSLIVTNINHTEDGSNGASTTVSGFSSEYAYIRKAPDCDISFFTMTECQKAEYEEQNPNPDSKVFIMLGDVYGAGGWTMHSIVTKIAEWMGIAVVNSLPDYDISDFSITLGSTFFESLNSLVSEFEPLITLSGSTLYIIERNSAGLMGGSITPVGFITKSIDQEYSAAPGCIKVEGGEGKYIGEKDPTKDEFGYVEMGFTGHTECKVVEHTVDTGEAHAEFYTESTYYTDPYDEKWAMLEKIEKCAIYTYGGSVVSKSETKTTTEYHPDSLSFDFDAPVPILESIKRWAYIAWRGSSGMEEYSIDTVHYEHDSDMALIRQIVSKKELFIYDEEEGTYEKYDPRDIYEEVEASVSKELIESEKRVTTYSFLNQDCYTVDTIIANKVYNAEDEEWQITYDFEHDLVEAGAQQKASGRIIISPGEEDEEGEVVPSRTMQVYAGDCPISPVLSVMEEPAKVFNIPTPSWTSIENCYIYLAAMAAHVFQKADIIVPIIDPLPLMGIGDVGIQNPYIIGYTINIDAASGNTTSLQVEARV